MKEITFRGKKVIVTEDRHEKFPLDLMVLGVRHSDNDWSKPVSVERFVAVNRWGFVAMEKSAGEDLLQKKRDIIILTKKERDLFCDRL